MLKYIKQSRGTFENKKYTSRNDIDENTEEIIQKYEEHEKEQKDD